MIVRMAKIMARRGLQAVGQTRIMNRAEKVAEDVLREVSRGYALPDTHQYACRGPAGDHTIFVAVPPGPRPDAGYPILFIVDANAIFGAAVDAMRLQMPWPEVSGVTPFMLVGVGYPGTMPFDLRRRSWDLAPPLRNPSWRSPLGLPWHQPGGADAFIDFLTGSLADAIATRYPADASRRGICGVSLGGTFALYALAARAEAFRFHVGVSSALWFDDARVIGDLKGLNAGDRPSSSALVAVGAEEIPADPNVSAMMTSTSRAAVIEIERIGCRATYLECVGENHQSTIIAALPRIMREASSRLC